MNPAHMDVNAISYGYNVYLFTLLRLITSFPFDECTLFLSTRSLTPFCVRKEKINENATEERVVNAAETGCYEHEQQDSGNKG